MARLLGLVPADGLCIKIPAATVALETWRLVDFAVRA